MLKNFTKCEHCIHNQVCSFETEQKELIDKIETHLNNEHPSKIFNVILECKAYQPNEDESSKMQYQGVNMTNFEDIIHFFNEYDLAQLLVVKIDDYNYTSNILFENFTTRQGAVEATIEKLKDTYNVNESRLFDKILKQMYPD